MDNNNHSDETKKIDNNKLNKVNTPYINALKDIQENLKINTLPLDNIKSILNTNNMPFQSIIENYKKSIFPLVTNQNYINTMTASMNSALNSLKPLINTSITQNMKHISDMINSLNISSFVSDYVNKYQKMMQGILDAIKPISSSKLSRPDSLMFKKYYWVIPFEYDYEKIQNLVKYKTRINFEKYIEKYFTEKRTRRLFNKLKSQFKEKDKKELIKQIENSYFNNDYAIYIASLMTLFDGSTMILLDSSSGNQHSSYKVIDAVLKYINERPLSEYSYELYLKVDILNNYIEILYRNVTDLKGSRRKLLLSRHINSHGVRYLNNKINVLRLLNGLYYCNEVIDELNLKEQFTKNGKNFTKI